MEPGRHQALEIDGFVEHLGGSRTAPDGPPSSHAFELAPRQHAATDIEDDLTQRQRP